MYAVLLRLQLFCMLALFAVVYLKCIVVAGDECKLACVVEVERGHRGAGGIRSKPLRMVCQLERAMTIDREEFLHDKA